MKDTYYKAWRLFNKFFLRLDNKPIDWEERLTLFVVYLIEEGHPEGTLTTYASAIKNTLRDDGIILDSDKLHLPSLFKACRSVNHSTFIRLPIQ